LLAGSVADRRVLTSGVAALDEVDVDERPQVFFDLYAIGGHDGCQHPPRR